MRLMTIWFAFVSILATTPIFAAEQDSTAPKGKTDRVNVDLLKQRYWAQGEESELSVVQNRKYKKKGTLETGLQLGSISTDPFLVVKSVGLRASYNFNEDFGIGAFVWKMISVPSDAYTTLEATTTARANVNSQSMFYGAEASYSPIYGKLSLLGKAIIYYDMKVMGGLGWMSTDTGSYFAPIIGIGQKVFLQHNISLSFDYRFVFYNETVVNRNPVGAASFNRTNYTHAITIGVDYLFNFSG